MLKRMNKNEAFANIIQAYAWREAMYKDITCSTDPMEKKRKKQTNIQKLPKPSVFLISLSTEQYHTFFI